MTKPTLNIGVYNMIGYLDESTGFPMYVWLGGPRKLRRPQLFVHV